ncbi:MAG: hypothetical protein IJ905_02305 [Fibrobacter sp.]|nr:hypothetical protein [Fibrobacter sp.]
MKFEHQNQKNIVYAKTGSGINSVRKSITVASFVFSLWSFIFLAACTDIGDRDNINDYDGINYAYGDDLYYLNRSEAGFEGEIRQGQVTGKYFIYNKEWREATDIEKNTYDYEQNQSWNAGENGDSKWGSVNTKNCYVFEDDIWRKGNATDCSLNLQGCIALRQDIMALGSDNKLYKCDSKTWREATNLEKESYDYGKNKPSSTGENGDSKWDSENKKICYVFEDSIWRKGDATDCSLNLRGCTALRQNVVALGNDNKWYKCDSKKWRIATTYEKDTFGWKDSTDGAIKKGNVTDSIYVFDKTTWRITSNVEAILGGCVSTIADSVGKVGSSYYICKSNSWVKASVIEYNTYRWAASKDGDAKYGDVVKTYCYVYEDNVWRSGNAKDCSLGLFGCTALKQDAVALGSDNEWYKCDSKTWRIATEIERDTVDWGAGKFDGEVRTGQVNKDLYYIYESKQKIWRKATTYEKDTFGWKDSTDGSIKKGNVTDSIYVFDKNKWRIADKIEKVLGGCVDAIADSIGIVDKTRYICRSGQWSVATALIIDTYKQKCSKDGVLFNGDVNKQKKYVCDNEMFREATVDEISADFGCTSYTQGEMKLLTGRYTFYYKCTENGWTSTNKLYVDSIVDFRDERKYKIVGIKSQIWMAENLNYADAEKYPSMLNRNWCYDDNLYNCLQYGRLYTWSAAIDSVYWAKQGMVCDVGATTCEFPEKVRGICPEGWHLPSVIEWRILVSVAETSLDIQERNSIKNYFSVILTGLRNDSAEYEGMGFSTYFWSSTINQDNFYSYGISLDGDISKVKDYKRNYGFSIRCIKDE